MAEQVKPAGSNPLATDTTKKKGGKGRSKADKRGTPISRYVRDEISAAEYFKLTGQRTK